MGEGGRNGINNNATFAVCPYGQKEKKVTDIFYVPFFAQTSVKSWVDFRGGDNNIDRSRKKSQRGTFLQSFFRRKEGV